MRRMIFERVSIGIRLIPIHRLERYHSSQGEPQNKKGVRRKFKTQ